MPNPLAQKDFSGAQISSISDTIAPNNSVSLLQNMDADSEIGSAVTRNGTETVGAQITAALSILGLHQHIDVDTPANNKLFATINASGGATSVIYDVIGAANSVTALTSNKKMRFLTFLGATLGLNGADAERSYTSAGWITTAGFFDLGNIPSSNTVNLCEEFLDRVYVAGDTAQPTRLYYSSVPTAGSVSWTSGNGNVDIEKEDGGGALTALSKVPGYLLVFKERSLHRWNFSSAFPESLVQIGTPTQECVVKGGGLCAFYSNSNENSKGFYITDGGRPKCISQDNNRPIKKWVDAIGNRSATFTAAVTDVITSTAHGLNNGDTVFVSSTTTLPAGLSVNTTYFVISSAANTFSLSANNGGSAVNITDTGTGTHTWFYSPVIAGWATDRYFAWSVGDLTVDGEDYENVVLRYNYRLNQWSVRTYPQEFKVFANYVVQSSNSQINTTVGGADDGTIYRMDKPGTHKDANTTATQFFPWKVRQHFLTYGENKEKVMKDKVAVRGKHLESARIIAYVDEVYEPIPISGKNFIKKVLSLFGIGNTIKGTSIALEVAGESGGAPCIVREIEPVSVSINDTYA